MSAAKKRVGERPNDKGYFGDYGGRFVPETLYQPVQELQEAYAKIKDDPSFQNEFQSLLKNYVGRETPLTYARRLSEHLGGAKIYLKREDLNHTGAHKINNSLGQALLAKHMGKKRLIAETGAGQHGVATATVSALLGLKCTVYMGAVDMKRQALNVYRMRLLGAEVVGVENGSKTLKDAISEAMRDWVTNVHESYYLLGSALGPHPYPMIVRDFQAVIGNEARRQILDVEDRLPDHLVACVGGGSNAIGLFHAFVDDENVKMTGVEAGGHGVNSGQHAARFAQSAEGTSISSLGVFQGTKTYLIQDSHGQVLETHSVSAGLDYAAVGPEHAYLRSLGRADYVSVTDEQALKGFHDLSRLEGIIPALESSHAIAYVMELAPKMSSEQILLVNLSGRGDKDVMSVKELEENS